MSSSQPPDKPSSVSGSTGPGGADPGGAPPAGTLLTGADGNRLTTSPLPSRQPRKSIAPTTATSPLPHSGTHQQHHPHHPSQPPPTHAKPQQPLRSRMSVDLQAGHGTGSTSGPTVSVPFPLTLPPPGSDTHQQHYGTAPPRSPIDQAAAVAAARARVLVPLINEESRRKAKALVRHRWDMLRAHVMRGFFHSIMNSNQSGPNAPVELDFQTVVVTLWDHVMQYSKASAMALAGTPAGVSNKEGRLGTGVGRSGGASLSSADGSGAAGGGWSTFDSTTEFIMASSRKAGGNRGDARHAHAPGRAAAAHPAAASGPGTTAHKPTDANAKPPANAASELTRASLTVGPTAQAAGAAQAAAPSNTAAKAATSTTATQIGHRAGAAVAPTGPSSSPFDPSSGLLDTAHLGRAVGLEYLTLDAVPNCNVGHMLMIIAKGLRNPPKKDEADFMTLQIHMNRGWKLILLGLRQAESVSRHVAMIALNRALPVIKETLVDNLTRFNLVSVLVNIVVSDERRENRLKAVYLLGQMGSILAYVREYHQLMLTAFKQLSKKLLEIQYTERKANEPRSDLADLKVHLFQAIGKFTRVPQRQSHFIEDLVMYMIYQETAFIERQMIVEGSTGDLQQTEPPMYVVISILGILNNDMKRTEMNKKYIGALFKNFVHPLMRSSNAGLQKMAIQFISNWLPIVNEDAVLQGIEAIYTGLLHSKTLQVVNFDINMYEEELELFTKASPGDPEERWKYTEQCRLSMRSKLLRELIQVPGTISKLLPVPGCPGFFCDANSSLTYTKSILMDLPIHGKSNVTLTRPILPIPGVPKAVTTIPPLFMDEGWAENLHPPKSRYEFYERTGRISTLPFGYTYSPNPLIDAMDPMAQIARREAQNMSVGNDITRHTILKNKALWTNMDEIPMGSTRMPPRLDARPDPNEPAPEPRRFPFGFSTVCPFPGFDPERIDRNAHPISPIYGRQTLGVRGTQASMRNQTGSVGVATDGQPGQGNNAVAVASGGTQSPPGLSRPGSSLRHGTIEQGYTFDRNPMLWPNRDPTLKSVVSPGDFPLNAPVILDIIQPHMPELQRVLTRVTSINQDLSAVTVQRDTNETGGLYIGAKFSIFVRPRDNEAVWVAVQLEVLDDDYHDDLDFSGFKASDELVRSQAPHAGLPHGATVSEGQAFMEGVALRRLGSPAGSGGAGSTNKTHDNTFAFPVPAGYTPQGEPYFSPPVNMPPLPAGYDDRGMPYYGRQPSVKPYPQGLTTIGTRFYPADGKLVESTQQRHQCGGFDIEGHPFFVPRGFSLPAPTGFTADGIPFYDVPSLMRQRGVMILPSTFQVVEATPDDEDDDWEELLPKIHRDGSFPNALQKKRVEATFVSKLSASLAESQPLLKHLLAQAHSRNMIPMQAMRDGKLNHKSYLEQGDFLDLQDPEDIPEFLRGGLEFSHLKPTTMRILLEPGQVEFQSVHAPLTKTIALRYRAGRGDHGERDFFLAVEPVEVFSLKTFHLRLQGEGVHEIVLTYNPAAMKSERTEGGLYLIDEFGKKMATCQLLAVRQSFFKVTPASLDLGWVLPERRKEAAFKIENISPIAVVVNFVMQSEVIAASSLSDLDKSVMDMQSDTDPPRSSIGAPGSATGRRGTSGRRTGGYSTASPTSGAYGNVYGSGTTRPASNQASNVKRSPFMLPVTSLRLQPLETKVMTVFFEPKMLGRATDVVEVRGPGGDVSRVDVVGMSGIPIAVYPETEESSSVGSNNLSFERTEFIAKFRRKEVSDKSHVALNENEARILQSIMAAQSDSDSRREAHTLDFGICATDTKVLTRCLTFMNLGDGPATISLFSHHPCITCPYLVRVAPRMANTVEVVLTIGEGSEGVRGNLRTAIEIVCPEFQSIPLHVKAFIGQAVYFPVWEYVFFKPAHIGQRQEISMSLINESQYDVHVCLEGLPSAPSGDHSSITTSLSTIDSEPTLCPAFSLVPVTFTFYAKERGPLMKAVTIRMVRPFRRLVSAAMFMKQMRLLGVCIEPYFRRSDDKTDKNGLEFLVKWMSHPKMVIDEYPSEDQRYQLFDLNVHAGIIAQARTRAAPAESFDVVFKADPYITEVQANGIDENLMGEQFRSTIASNPLAVQNRGNTPKNVRFIASTGFVLEPQYKTLQPGELQKLENYFNAPPDIGRLVTIYGFSAVLDETDHSMNSTQMIKRLASGILVLPLLGSDHQVVIDFGKIEITGETMTENNKNLLLKFNPFDAPLMTGEVTGYETFTVPFKFKCDVSGIYETTCEVYITDTSDKFAKPIKVGTVILRGVAVNTSLSGLPDAIDFGAVVVFNTKRRVYTLMNNGTSDLSITALVRPPFTVMPKSFTITSKSQMDVEVFFKPNEARNIQTKMQVFANQRLFLIPTSGLGGSADLVCEKYQDRALDFGDVREGTIGWCSIYLTNKGSLPLVLKSVSTDAVGLPKLQYVSQTASIPIEFSAVGSSGRDVDQFEVKKNYWGILKRKYKTFTSFKTIINQTSAAANASLMQHVANGKSSSTTARKRGEMLRQMEKAPIMDFASIVPIANVDTVVPAKSSLPKIPELRPFYSYHFRLGYTASYQSSQACDLVFHYMPVMGEDETTDVPVQSLIKSTTLSLTGEVYRPLELFPPSLDFGYAPAERYLENPLSRLGESRDADEYGVTPDKKELGHSVLSLEVVNMSMVAQNLHLRSISPEFSTQSRSWYIQAGEKLEFQIEFHPPREQIQYHGEAVFQHKYGMTSVHLTGTGASADLVSDEVVNFGSLKLGTTGQRTFQIHNRGLLEAKYELDIVQSASEFRFLTGDPYECEGVIPSGGTRKHTIECRCTNVDGSSAMIMVKWRRIPKGVLERFTVPLKVQVGYPAFRMQNLEIDFKTTYVDVNKTLDFRLYNEGNASCCWHAEWDNPCIQLDVTSGNIGAGETVLLKVTFAPRDYDTLASAVRFFTDAGNPTLMCYGVVGVPYLKIPVEMRDIDFGIVSVEHTHTRSINMANTGSKNIDYEIVVLTTFKNGVECGQDEFDAFYAQPTSGSVEPGMAVMINISIYPRDYSLLYASTYILRTKDGEQYSGRVTARGGKAIVKIKAPTIATGDTRQVIKPEPGTSSLSGGQAALTGAATTSVSGTSNITSSQARPFQGYDALKAPPVPQIEVSRYVLQSHLDNLYEVLAGLRTAELDITRKEETVPEAAMAPMQAAMPQHKKGNMQGLAGNRGQQSRGAPAIGAAGDKSSAGDAGRLGLGPTTGTGSLSAKNEPEPVILDGSNLKQQSRGAARAGSVSDQGSSAASGSTGTPATRPESKSTPDTASLDSRAVRFTDELAQLEKELEIAIGMRDPVASILSGSGSMSGSGSVPGTAEAESKPGSPVKKHAGGLGKYQPGRRRGHRRRDQGEEDLPVGTKPPSQGSRGVTPFAGPTPMTPAEESIARSLTSRGLVGNGMDMNTSIALAEVQAQKSKIENILSLAQDMTLTTGVGLDKPGQQDLVDTMSDRVLDNTHMVIKAVKEQLANDKWVPNREFLQQALRRLQMSTIAIENFRKPTEDEPMEENVFNLGLMRGGDKSESTLLFSIPNEGNISFDYRIEANKNDVINPPGNDELAAHEGDEAGPFRIDPIAGYSVMSGDEAILSFTVLARVGNPNLIISPRAIDFGLVEKGKTLTKVFVISNTGGYHDFWRLEQRRQLDDGSLTGDDEDAMNSPFKMTQTTGETRAAESTPIQISFSPSEEGQFKAAVRVIWTKDPLLVTLTGTGGGCRLEFTYDDPSDRSFGGLDFGICSAGTVFTKRVKIRNIGTVTGLLELSHPSRTVLIDVPRDDAGEIHLGPGATVELKVTLTPEKTEIIKDPITVVMGASGTQAIPLKARCGAHEWKIEGELNFLNMPILESQTQTLSIINSGTLDLPLEVKLEPESAKAVVTVTPKADNWIIGRPMRPNQTVLVEATAASDTQQMVQGKVVVRTKMRGEVVTREFPFNFRIYVDEVAVDDVSDVAVGRVMVGETVTAVRSVTNYGNTRIRYRARVEGITEHDEDMAWRILGNKEGVLDANETISIEAIFESMEGKGDGWQEAKLIIERRAEDGSDKWSLLSHLKLVGAAGHPDLTLEPSELDFGPTGVGTEKRLTVHFKNDGNALLNYELQEPWEAFDEIKFAPDFSPKGIINAGESRSVQIIFSPRSKEYYSSVIYIKTPIGDRILSVHGEGAAYMIYRQAIPEVIEFGEVSLTEVKEIEASAMPSLNLQNGCTHDIDVEMTVYEEEPFDPEHLPKVAEHITVHPRSLRLKHNISESERTKMLITARACVPAPLDDEGYISNDFVKRFPIGRQFTYYLKVDVLRGKTDIIPIDVTFSAKPPTLLSKFLYADSIAPADYVTKVDFGSQSVDGGAKKKFMLFNSNAFKIKYRLEASNPQFIIFPTSGMLNPRTCKDILIELKGLELKGDEVDIPKISEFNAVLKMTTHLDAFGPISIPLTGILVDQAPVLDVPDEIDFGTIYRQKRYKIELSIRNPARRPLRWRFYVDRAMADVFVVEGRAEDVTQAKKSFFLRVAFNPAMAVSYKSTAFLETDAGNATIALLGTGVQPAIEVYCSATDFGVVGINAPEYRDITITNPQDLRLRLRARSDNKHFQTSINEFDLGPNEAKTMRVYFSPTSKARTESGNIAFFNLDDLPEGSEDSDDESTGSGDSREPKPMTPRRELELLKEITFGGMGGEFGFHAEGMDTTTESGDPNGLNIISIKFPKVNQRQKTRKSFEVENVGDTVLELGVYDMAGAEMDSQVDSNGDKQLCSYRVSPSTVQVPSRGKEKITITVQGVDKGEDSFEFIVKTKTLINPKAIKIHVTANVLSSATDESLRAFARADMSMEVLLNVQMQEEERYATERELWKLLLPIVRLSAVPPSLELQSLPAIEPNVTRPDIGPYVVRPPAIPPILPQRAKKWYMNRVSMALEGFKSIEQEEATEDYTRRQEAIEFLQPLEKKMFLEKKRDR
ncbi:hypothetical protein BC831DRAFT_550468 [Entophlyctis helioformis]|nr:hypothetical protein BC831DRAFT_550468 [Entophlyctis helioformis]